MRISVRVIPALLLPLLLLVVVQAFVVPRPPLSARISAVRLHAEDERVESSPSSSVATAPSTKMKEIGLLTFDLDDTLYPIAPVVRDANGACVLQD